MNFAAILALFNYGLVLIYGVLLSIDISGGWSSKKDKQLTAAIIAFLLMVQIVVCLTSGTTAAEKLYPLITHIPLVFALFLFMKRPIWISMVSVFTAYLCCQIPNWFSILVLNISDSALLSEISYTYCLIYYLCPSSYVSCKACIRGHELLKVDAFLSRQSACVLLCFRLCLNGVYADPLLRQHCRQ